METRHGFGAAGWVLSVLAALVPVMAIGAAHCTKHHFWESAVKMTSKTTEFGADAVFLKLCGTADQVTIRDKERSFTVMSAVLRNVALWQRHSFFFLSRALWSVEDAVKMPSDDL